MRGPELLTDEGAGAEAKTRDRRVPGAPAPSAGQTLKQSASKIGKEIVRRAFRDGVNSYYPSGPIDLRVVELAKRVFEHAWPVGVTGASA
jgi:hypothetical protein